VAFIQIDFSESHSIFQHTNLFKIIFLTFILSFLINVQAIRWWLIGKKLGFKWGIFTAIELAYIGNFFNQILPGSTGGDVVRAWALKKANIPIELALSSIIIDRISALIAISLIFVCGSPVLYKFFDVEFTINKYIFLLIVLCAAISFMLCIKFQPFKENRIVKIIGVFIVDVKAVFLSPIDLCLTTLLSLIIQISISYIVWQIALDFGAKFNFLGFMLLWAVVFIISLLPISIAGWGVREGAMVAAFTLLDTPPTIAFATSITIGLLILIASLPGLLIWLVRTFHNNNVNIIAEKTHGK